MIETIITLRFRNVTKTMQVTNYSVNRIIQELLNSTATPTSELRKLLCDIDNKYSGIIIGADQLSLDPHYSEEFTNIIKSSKKYKAATNEFKVCAIKQIILTEYDCCNSIFKENIDMSRTITKSISDLYIDLINNTY